MLIVEYLHLLLTRSDGYPEGVAQRRPAQTAALLTDLAVAERVALTADTIPRLRVLSASPTGHAVLDAVLPSLAACDGLGLERVITRRDLDPYAHVVASLVEHGALDLGKRTLLGLGAPLTPERDPGPEREIRGRLAAVLAGSAAADQTEATLLIILRALDVAHRILRDESGGMRPRALSQRIDEITEASAVGTAVATAVQAISASLAVVAIVSG